VLDKVRRGDHDVQVTMPGIERFTGRTPVLVDDIVSTGRTMAAAATALRARGMPAPVVVAVHAVWADGAAAALDAAGIARAVTTNTVPHPSNAIDVAKPTADGVLAALDRRG
jgi:ribose-phosphate pyrophosphokinase